MQSQFATTYLATACKSFGSILLQFHNFSMNPVLASASRCIQVDLRNLVFFYGKFKTAAFCVAAVVGLKFLLFYQYHCRSALLAGLSKRAIFLCRYMNIEGAFGRQAVNFEEFSFCLPFYL